MHRSLARLWLNAEILYFSTRSHIQSKFRGVGRFLNPPKHPSSTTPTVQQLLANSLLKPQWTSRYDKETPLERLYLMYHFFVIGDLHHLSHLVQDFCSHSKWKVKDIQDPEDPDPERYAILAVIPYWLCEVFNVRIGMCLHRDAPAIIDDETELELRSRPKVFEEVPEWTKHVPKLETKVVIPREDERTPRVECWCEELVKLNVVAEKPALRFI